VESKNKQGFVMGLTIVNFTPYEKGSLQGYLEVKVEGWRNFVIRGIAVFKNQTSRWISFPSQIYEKDGVKKYKPYAKFESKEDMDAFQNEVLKALDKVIAKPKVEEKPLYFTKQASQMEIPF